MDQTDYRRVITALNMRANHLDHMAEENLKRVGSECSRTQNAELVKDAAFLRREAGEYRRVADEFLVTSKVAV